MCTNRRYINNRYIHRQILVDCGKCKACLQEKAVRRSSRIRNNISDGQICLFVTLTYDNRFVPYIDTRGLKFGDNYNVPIYRDYRGRYIRFSSTYHQKFYAVRERDSQVIGYIPYLRCQVQDFARKSSSCLRSLVGHQSSHVGLCYYQDVINFIKRFRQCLQRHYNCYEKFTYFSCSEYGGKTQRPHFHLLIFIPSFIESVARNSILEAWPYADINRTSLGIEVARDCAGYVSSYVNGNNCLSSVLTNNSTKQKHSYSHGFGVGFSEFHPEKILEKVDSGTLTYRCSKKIDGIATYVVLPIPKYVISRIFPRFKGYSRLSVYSLSQLLQCPERLNCIAECSDIGYTNEDWYRIKVMLDNSYKLYVEHFPNRTRVDYAIDYLHTWNCYYSTCLKMSHENKSLFDYLHFYENVSEYTSSEGVYSQSLANLIFDIGEPGMNLEKDYNNLPDIVQKTNNLTQMYDKYSKQKDISHYIIEKSKVYG